MGWLKKVTNAAVTATTGGLYNPETGFAGSLSEAGKNFAGAAVTTATLGTVDMPDKKSSAPASTGNLEQDYLNFMKQQYAEQKPLYDETTKLTQEFQRQQNQAATLANMASAEDRARYLQNFAPVETALAGEAMTAGGLQDQTQQANLAKGDIGTGIANQRAISARTMASMGVNPNSARFAATQNSDNIAAAAQEGAAMTRARQAAQALGWSKKMDATSIGKGIASQQTTALNAASAAGSAGSSAATGALNSQNASTNGVAGAYGTGINAQTARTTAQMRADAAEAAGMGQLFGTAIGAGAAIF